MAAASSAACRSVYGASILQAGGLSIYGTIVELRIKVDLHLGQKVEEEEDFHVTKISSLSTKAISTTKLD